MRRDGGSDVDSAQGFSPGGQFVQQVKLRMVAREAALREIAKSKSLRPSAQNKSFDCADVKAGAPVISLLVRISPRQRGPAVILGIDETGAAAKFQGHVSAVAR